jgi:hypothetical protein
VITQELVREMLARGRRTKASQTSALVTLAQRAGLLD